MPGYGEPPEPETDCYTCARVIRAGAVRITYARGQSVCERCRRFLDLPTKPGHPDHEDR